MPFIQLHFLPSILSEIRIFGVASVDGNEFQNPSWLIEEINPNIPATYRENRRRISQLEKLLYLRLFLNINIWLSW